MEAPVERSGQFGALAVPARQGRRIGAPDPGVAAPGSDDVAHHMAGNVGAESLLQLLLGEVERGLGTGALQPVGEAPPVTPTT